MENPVISVKNVSKIYHIYDKPKYRLYQLLSPILSKFSKKFKGPFYREFQALTNINFELNKGESIGFIGQNGAGKSTLLQILAGTLSPTNGEVEVTGRVNALLELGSGFNPEFTGRENVYMNGAILGFSKDFIESKFNEIHEFSEIGDFIDQPVKTYSSGMFVRLAFSVQALMEPEILIIDEALSVGDIFFQSKCFKIIDKLLNDGKTTFIFVSHDIHSVIRYCKRSVLLRNGKIIYSGDSVIASTLYHKMDRFSETELIEEGKKIDDKNCSSEKKEANASLEENYIPYNKPKFANGDFSRIELIGYKLTSSGKPPEFYVKEKIKFSFLFRSHDRIEVPLIAMGIASKNNLTVYAKYNFQINRDEMPRLITNGSQFIAEFEINLDLIPGEYMFTLIFNEMKKEDYEVIHSFSINSFSENVINLFGVVVDSFNLTVSTKDLFLPFNGLVDLTTEYKFMVTDNKL